MQIIQRIIWHIQGNKQEVKICFRHHFQFLSYMSLRLFKSNCFLQKATANTQSIKNHYHVFTFHTKILFFWLIYIIFVGSLLLNWNFINFELKDNFCINNPWCNCYFSYTIPCYIIFIYSHALRGSATSWIKWWFHLGSHFRIIAIN